MKLKNILKKAGAAAMIAAVMATTVFPAFAASSTAGNNNTATENDLADSDIIDTSRTGSLSIYKYDITSAVQDGVYEEGKYDATGKTDTVLESELANYAVEGVEYSYLHVGNVETYSVLNSEDENFVQLVYEIPVDLAAILGLTRAESITMTGSNISAPCTNTGVYHYTSQQINDALKDILEADNISSKNNLEEYVIGSSASVALPLTDKEGHTGAEALDLGLYLVVETKVPEEVIDTTNPWFVQIPMTNLSGNNTEEEGGTSWFYDITCYPKNQTGNPTLDKLVANAHGEAAAQAGASENYHYLTKNSDESNEKYVANREEYTYDSTTTASEGDILNYILVSRLPVITSETTYLTQYTFVDTLSEGLTYNKNVQMAFYDNADDANVNNTKNAKVVWDLYNAGFETDYVEVLTETLHKTGQTQLTVSFTEKGLKLLNENYSGHYIVVYYSVTVDSNAKPVLGDEGNLNDVTLTWERTSENYYNTLEDRCYVFTYGIDLTKKFSDDQGDPTKVQFVLYNQTDTYYVLADNVGKTVDGKKVYYVTGKTTEKSKATIFSPDETGQMVVNGLEGDTYQLTEVATDSGYSLLKDQIVISINTASREISPSVAGHTGLTPVAHTHTETCFDKKGALICGYQAKHVHTDDCYSVDSKGKKTDILICGYANSDDAANGRTIGKIAMSVGELMKSSASVDDVAANMSSYIITADQCKTDVKLSPCNSDNAIVDLAITNSKGFLLPVTGGRGLYAITIIGVIAVAVGCYFIAKKRKKHNTATEAQSF